MSTLFGIEAGAAGNAVVLGLPFGHGSTVGSSVGEAPRVLREVSQELTAPLWDLASNKPISLTHATDMGDLRYRASTSRQAYLEFVSEASASLAAAGKRCLFLGGDHLITLAVLRGYKNAAIPLQFVQLDAHQDMAGDGKEAQPTHASFMRWALNENLFENALQVGIRGFGASPREESSKLRVCSVSDLAGQLKPMVTYLSIDTDAFDPNLAPAVDYPVIGGLAWQDLVRTVDAIRSHATLVAADWTEYVSGLDGPNRLTARGIVHGLLAMLQALQ